MTTGEHIPAAATDVFDLEPAYDSTVAPLAEVPLAGIVVLNLTDVVDPTLRDSKPVTHRAGSSGS